MDGMTGTRTYEQYLAEANAELDEMLMTGTPDPKPEPPQVNRGLVKVILLAVVAVVVLCIGFLLLRGARPRRLAARA